MEQDAPAAGTFPRPRLPVVRALRSASRALAGLALAIGAVVLLAWAADWPLVTTLHEGWISMKANTALCLVLAGASVLSLGSSRAAARAATRVLPAIVVAFGAVTLLEYAAGVDTGLDDVILRETGPVPAGTHPGRMATVTAIGFVVCGSATLLLASGRVVAAQALAAAGTLPPLLSLFAHVFRVGSMYGLGPHLTVAFHTAVALLSLHAALLFVAPDRGLVGPLTSDTPGGVLARRLAPGVVLVPLAVGLGRRWLEERGVIDSGFGVALMVEAMVLLLGLLLWPVAASLAWADVRRSEVEEGLHRTTSELARSNRELERFAYAASHDLQEPLRAVAGCVQLLQRRYAGRLDPGADELVRHAVEGATRMQRLIEGLLAVSRVATRGAPLQAVAAGEPLRSALANLAVAIAESGASVTSDPLPSVLADPAQLTQLFQNLVGNALKFRSERPCTVHVSAEARDGTATFTVKDNGIGVPAEYHDRIFGLFQRLHTREEIPGDGIGLALCRRIVERHGGRLWLESRPGEGSSFHFTLATGG